MRSWLAGFRRLAGHDDAAEAYEAERGEIQATLDRPAIDPRIMVASEELLARSSATTAVLGTAVADPRVTIPLDLAALPSHTHLLCVGASGSGKTCLLALLCRQVVRARIAGIPFGLYLHAPKNDFGQLVVELLARELVPLPLIARERFLSGFRYIDPFSDTGAPVPLNILAPIPGVPPQVQAYEVATSMGHVGGEGLGVNQGSFFYNAILAAIGRATLPELHEVMGDSARLATFAAGSPHREVRDFLARERIAVRSIEGVRSRIHSLLRVPAVRRCLEAETCLSFPELLEKVSILCTGAAPLGCEDIGKAFDLVFAARLGRAVFSRRDRGEIPCLVMLDEFQTILGAGAYAAETAERLLNQARSRDVSLVLATQALANVGRASATLPEIVTTNCGVIMAFRSSPSDVRILADALPTTGRRLRAAPAPWEPWDRSPHLTPGEERQALLAEAASLPARHLWLWNRTAAGGAVLVRSADVVTDAEDAERARVLLRRQAACAERGRARDGGVSAGVPAGAFRARRSAEPHGGRFQVVRGDAARPAPQPEAAHDGERADERVREEGPRRRGRGRPRRRDGGR